MVRKIAFSDSILCVMPCAHARLSQAFCILGHKACTTWPRRCKFSSLFCLHRSEDQTSKATATMPARVCEDFGAKKSLVSTNRRRSILSYMIKQWIISFAIIISIEPSEGTCASAHNLPTRADIYLPYFVDP